MQIFWWCHGDELQQKEKEKKKQKQNDQKQHD
jgi:hypothetical protein